MSIMPGAMWRPVPVSPSRPRRRKGRGIVLHVAVSEATSLHGYFSTASADSHFYVAKDGHIEQYVDTDLVAYCQGAGNASLISVETQGGVRNADGEPWTPQQVTALARIVAWAAEIDGFPLTLMPDSRPTSRGVGYHRLGCRPWVVAGGELWSSATGKVCPGAAKIAQIPQIIAIANQEDDDMPLTEAEIDRIARRVHELTWARQDDPKRTVNLKEFLRWFDGTAAQQEARIAALTSVVAAGAGVDANELKAHISSEVERAMQSFRERVAEGYEVRLQPKGDEPTA